MYIFIRPANFCGEVYGLSLEPSRVPHCYCFGLFLKQFDYDVPWLCMCLCVGIHPIWGLIQILNMWVYNFPPIWKNFSHSKKYIFMAPLGGLHLLYINPISSLKYGCCLSYMKEILCLMCWTTVCLQGCAMALMERKSYLFCWPRHIHL